MKVCVGSIAYRTYESAHVHCLMQLLSQENVMWAAREGDALVERSRAIAATRFLRKTDADVLLTIDSDILFRPDDALRICEAAMEHDIVAGLYVTRSAQECRPTSILQNLAPVDFRPGHTELVPARWAASGFMATHRRVFEAMIERLELPLCHADEEWAFWPFYTPFALFDGHEMNYLSEDYAFCEHATQLGFGVWVDPAVKLGHIGQYVYQLDDIPAKPTQHLVGMTRLETGQYRLDIAEVGDNAPVAAG